MQFAGKYKYPSGTHHTFVRRRDPFNNLANDSGTGVGSYQSSSNTIPVNGVYYKDNSINISYCQKEYLETILYNRLDDSETLNYISATVTVGIENGLALVGAATMFGLNPRKQSMVGRSYLIGRL